MINSIGTYLNSCGFYETINVSFVDNSVAGLFANDDDAHLAVKDESRKSANLLRQTLIGSLMEILKTNVNAKNQPCRIFEISETFAPAAGKKNELPVEKTKLTLVCDGEFRDLRGVIEGLIKNISSDVQVDFVPADLKWAQTGAQITVNSKSLGTAGIVGKAIKEKFELKEITPCAAELEFEFFMSLQGSELQVKPIPRFPAIQRDLSIIVDEQIPWADINKAVWEKASSELQQLDFIGIYRGKGIPQGRKSVTLSLQFRDDDGTLTHETVDSFQKEIVQSLSDAVEAVLRDS